MVECISIFSGAGGLDAGAKQAGARIVAAIEIDHDSTKTLRQNGFCPAHNVLETDIREVDFTQWRRTGPNILIGGPPCQPFSKNGYWVRNDNRLIADDPRNMLGQFLRAVSEMQPAGFLFENVDSILHPTNKPSLEGFLAVAEELGYTCTLFRAYALDFGIPQRRRRVFVFGIRGKHASLPDPQPTHADPADPKRNPDLPHYEGVGRFISPFSGDAFREPQEDASAGTYFEELLNVPAGKNYIALSSLENYSGRTFRSGSRFWNFLFKLHPDMPSITIAAQPGPWVGPFHWDSRRLRVPEIAAIQTFPDGYQFFGNRRSVQRQIGNAVPTLLGRRMIEHLLSHIS